MPHKNFLKKGKKAIEATLPKLISLFLQNYFVPKYFPLLNSYIVSFNVYD
jgi:hypothetical protein